MLTPGTLLQGRYRIDKQVGQGGMGAVYRATMVRLADRVVAIKQLLPAPDAEEQALFSVQFQREARILATLKHPGLVSVMDCFEEEDSMYLVMEFVDGQNLAQIVRDLPSPSQVDAILGWADQLTEVLSYLHHHDPPIIVRDLKPANLMLESNGHLRLIDFGIAREHVPGANPSTMARSGTPGFAPPEQWAGKTDARSDIYSFGATLYALLTAATPPSAGQRLADGYPLPSVSEGNPAVCAEVSAQIDFMMALKRGDRPQTIDDVREGLALARQAQAQFRPGQAPLPPPPAVPDVAPTVAVAPPLKAALPTQMFPQVSFVGDDVPMPVAPSPAPLQRLTIQPLDAAPSSRDEAPTGGPPPNPVPATAPLPYSERPIAVQFDRFKHLKRFAVAVAICVTVAVWQYRAHIPQPVEPISNTAIQTAHEPSLYKDDEADFQILVPDGWWHGPRDPACPGIVPRFSRLTMSSVTRTRYVGVECIERLSTPAAAANYLSGLVDGTATLRSLNQTAEAGDVYDAEVTLANQHYSGRSYLHAEGHRAWRLSLWCQGPQFDEHDPVLAAILASYKPSR